MTILTLSDFGGYCSKQDNLSMVIQLLNNLNNFYNFLLQQAIIKDYQQTNNNTLFLFNTQN